MCYKSQSLYISSPHITINYLTLLSDYSHFPTITRTNTFARSCIPRQPPARCSCTLKSKYTFLPALFGLTINPSKRKMQGRGLYSGFLGTSPSDLSFGVCLANSVPPPIVMFPPSDQNSRNRIEFRNPTGTRLQKPALLKN